MKGLNMKRLHEQSVSGQGRKPSPGRASGLAFTLNMNLHFRISAAAAAFPFLSTLCLEPAFSQTLTADSFNPGPDGAVYALALQSDGNVLVGGQFTTLNGQPRTNLGRLNPDGSLDSQFNPGAEGLVYSLAVQPDGKILVGGQFTALDGQSCNYLGRLNAEGTLDSGFNLRADNEVSLLAVQPEGKILVGGLFTTLSGQGPSYLGRLNPDGTLDSAFASVIDGPVESLALQADGKIVIGGAFATVDGQGQAYLGRLNADGTLDTAFAPKPDNDVSVLAVQGDGKILLAGAFQTLSGWNCSYLGRLNTDGTPDEGFNPAPDGPVLALAAQADGDILVGGAFSTLGGQWCFNLGRLNGDGTLDSTFNPEPDGEVNSFALQTDGSILVGGIFDTVCGESRANLARLNNTEPATQSLSYGGSTITWQLGGASPQVCPAAFLVSTNAANWTLLGTGTSTPGGWELPGVSLPPHSTVMARGSVSGGYQNGSAWLIQAYYGSPIIVSRPAGATGNPGTTATFSVTAAGSEPFSFQWLEDGVPLADGGGVAGTQTATLSLINVSHTNAGAYSVVVSNSFGSVTSAPATFTVLDPAIAVQPSSQSADVGQNVTFTVTAAGTPPFGYQWWRDGAPLAGATASTLTLTNLGRGHAGNYSVLVTNQYGGAYSAAATLGVNLATADPGFILPNGAPPMRVWALAEQWDGKILVGSSVTVLPPIFGLEPPEGFGIERLNADGTLDSSFNAVVSGPGSQDTFETYSVYTIAVQVDGKILVGGQFPTLNGQSRANLGRLNPDGSLDNAFNPGAGGQVSCLALQADGKILVGGSVTNLDGQPRANLGRLNPDGSLDRGFNAQAGSSVTSIAVQPDGTILWCGPAGLGLLNADGSMATNFNPQMIWGVDTMAVQGDGKILIGGWFGLLGSPPDVLSRSHIARLNPDGMVDTNFNPGASDVVESLAVQADGKILAAGQFTTLGGQPRAYLGRLNPDGTVDDEFNPGADNWVTSVAVQADGKTLVGGWFQKLDRHARNGFGRLNSTEPATQSVNYDGSAITWLRGGTSPEIWRADFQLSTNAADWTPLGEGSRVSGGWQLAATNLPPRSSVLARGWVDQWCCWFVEDYYGAPFLISQPASQTNIAETTAILSVVAEGSEPLAFQWFKDGVPLLDGGSVGGAQTAVLTITNLARTNTGGYTVVVSNALGSVTSALASLDVLDPAIAVQPASQSQGRGASVTLRVTAVGTAPFGYQWWQDGVALAGATGRTLELTSLGATNAGNYWVVVTNQFGSLTSTVAELTVNLAIADPFVDLGTADGWVQSFALQGDGEVLIGGSFQTVAGETHWTMARLNAGGGLDATFKPWATGPQSVQTVSSLAVQPDGMIVVGGQFTNLDGQARLCIGRLNAGGTLDTLFDPGADSLVTTLALQPDGKILVGGQFTNLAGRARGFLGRLNADGTLDTQFAPGPDNYVCSLAVQPDGMIVVGGLFTNLAGQARNCIGRLNADGSLDSQFDPGANGPVYTLALQADGAILAGGLFTTLGGQPCGYLGRLNADGTLDRQFNAGANSAVYSLAVQANGRIVAGGGFTSIGGQARVCIACLDADGTAYDEFDPGTTNTPLVTNYVGSVALQADGRVLVGGQFTTLAGWSCNGPSGEAGGWGGRLGNGLGGLLNPDTASQSISYGGSAITWLRGGSSPEVWRTTFEVSTDGANWTALGDGLRIPGGWQLSAVLVPPGATIRARGYYSSGQDNGSSSLAETLLTIPRPVPPRIILNDGRFGFGTNGFGFNVSAAVGQAIAVDCSSNLLDWLALQTNTLSSGPFYFSDPAAKAKPRQFYRARLVP